MKNKKEDWVSQAKGIIQIKERRRFKVVFVFSKALFGAISFFFKLILFFSPIKLSFVSFPYFFQAIFFFYIFPLAYNHTRIS